MLVIPPILYGVLLSQGQLGLQYEAPFLVDVIYFTFITAFVGSSLFTSSAMESSVISRCYLCHRRTCASKYSGQLLAKLSLFCHFALSFACISSFLHGFGRVCDDDWSMIQVPNIKYCHVYQSLKMGFGLVIGSINHLQVVTTNNYDTIAGLHNLQSLHTNLLSLFPLVFSSRFLATDL
jgi:hypothetical protein